HRRLRRQLRVITVVVGPVEGRREVTNVSRLPVVAQLEVHTTGTGGATVYRTCINDVLDDRGQHAASQRATVVQHGLHLGISRVAGDVVRIDGILQGRRTEGTAQLVRVVDREPGQVYAQVRQCRRRPGKTDGTGFGLLRLQVPVAATNGQALALASGRQRIHCDTCDIGLTRSDNVGQRRCAEGRAIARAHHDGVVDLPGQADFRIGSVAEVVIVVVAGSQREIQAAYARPGVAGTDQRNHGLAVYGAH